MDADVVLDQVFDFGLHRRLHQMHQAADLGFGPPPVLGREAEDGQMPHPSASAVETISLRAR